MLMNKYISDTNYSRASTGWRKHGFYIQDHILEIITYLFAWNSFGYNMLRVIIYMFIVHCVWRHHP